MFSGMASTWCGLSGAGLVLALALSACTTSHSPSGTPSSASAENRPTAVSAADLRAALLTAGDLPSGYVARQVTGAGLGDSSLAGCPALASDPKGASESASVVLADSASGSSVSETLLQMPAAEAAAAVAVFQKLPTTCRSFSGSLDGYDVTFRSAPLAVTSAGGQLTASRITGKIAGVAASLYTDVVVIRDSGTLIVVSTGGLTADTAFTERMADEAYALVVARW